MQLHGFTQTDASMKKIYSDLTNARIGTEWKPLIICNDNPDLLKFHRKLYCSIHTVGDDGACSLHSVFGSPCATRNQKLFAQDARARYVATIGASASEFKKRLECNELYANVTSALWHEGLYPILQRELMPAADVNISRHGSLMWKSVSTDERLRQNLCDFVRQESSRMFNDSCASATANKCFSRICHRKYNGFLLILAQLLRWEVDESPSSIVRGEERVRGTQILMPSTNRPRTKFDALFDLRPCFDAIRQGFLELYGRNLFVVRNDLENALANFCTELRTDPAIVELNAAITDVVSRQMSECSAPPPRFIDDIWPHYLHALEHNDYWLSYDELLAVARIAGVRLMVVEERDAGF